MDYMIDDVWFTYQVIYVCAFLLLSCRTALYSYTYNPQFCNEFESARIFTNICQNNMSARLSLKSEYMDSWAS